MIEKLCKLACSISGRQSSSRTGFVFGSARVALSINCSSRLAVQYRRAIQIAAIERLLPETKYVPYDLSRWIINRDALEQPDLS